MVADCGVGGRRGNKSRTGSFTGRCQGARHRGTVPFGELEGLVLPQALAGRHPELQGPDGTAGDPDPDEGLGCLPSSQGAEADQDTDCWAGGRGGYLRGVSKPAQN